MDSFFSFFQELGNETNVTTTTDLTATDVWVTMSLGTVGLIISILITIFCFKEKRVQNEEPDKINPSPLLKDTNEKTPLVLHTNE